MKHIKLHLLLTYYKDKLDLSELTLATHIQQYYEIPVTQDDLTMFRLSVQPKPKQVANALKSEGLGPTEIAEFMQTSIHNVRYYLQNPGKAIYTNPYWQLKFERGHTTINTAKLIQTTTEQKQRIQENMQKYNKN
jgi:hypothetical protein